MTQLSHMYLCVHTSNFSSLKIHKICYGYVVEICRVYKATNHLSFLQISDLHTDGIQFYESLNEENRMCQLCMHVLLNLVTYTDSIIQCLYTVYSKYLIHMVQFKGNFKHTHMRDEYYLCAKFTCWAQRHFRYP